MTFLWPVNKQKDFFYDLEPLVKTKLPSPSLPSQYSSQPKSSKTDSVFKGSLISESLSVLPKNEPNHYHELEILKLCAKISSFVYKL